MMPEDLQPTPRSISRGRPKVHDMASRRQNILESAYQAFIEHGFASTSTAEVARRAKVSKRTLYEVFQDKQPLFAAVISERHHLLLDLPRPDDEDCPPSECLCRIFRLDISDEAYREREAVLKLMTRESVLFPELSDYLYRTRAINAREMLMEWLQDCVNRKGFEPVDPEVCAGMLMDIVFGALMPRRQPCRMEERQIAMSHIKKRIQIMLQGMNWSSD